MIDAQNQILESVEAYVIDFFKQRIPGEYVYHNLEHTQDVVDATITIASEYPLNAREKEVLQIAAWFHDTGYDQGADKHEERSVQYAAAFLSQHDYPLQDLESVLTCIRATRINATPQNLLEEILRDADYSHLGSTVYWDRCSRVRQELLVTRQAFMSEAEWVNFELDFITSHEFHTEVAERLYGKLKEKHVKQLLKHRSRIIPEAKPVTDDKPKKKKKKKKGNEDLSNYNLGRGVETMYRTTYRTHVNLSSIADNKANIMLSINAIIISIVVSSLVPQFATNQSLVIPTMLLLAVCLTALVFAILSTRPKVTEGRFSREDIEEKKSNLLFFGNFYKMDIEDFHWGMMEMIKDSDFLYSSMTRDLYYLGVVLAKKYHYLRICYGVFMYGIILSVIAFGVAYLVKG